jgi:excisionase family DNA binding protein
MEQQAYTIEEAAKAGGGSRSTIYEEIRAGRLRARKRGRSTVILTKDLREWLEGLPLLDPKAPSRDRAIAQHAVAVRHGRRIGSQSRARNKFKYFKAAGKTQRLPK